MTSVSVVALGLAAVVAVADWFAVRGENKRLEYVCKPGVMVLLLLTAILMRPLSGVERNWFVVALALGLLGDVFLMLPRERFLPGLVSFLLGHLAFICGFVAGGLSVVRAAGAAVLLVCLALLLLPPVLRGARGHTGMVPAVLAYVLVISAMVAAAFASRQPLVVVPAALFFTSDTLIAYRRFVGPRPWMNLAVIVTYHLAQAGLVLWLAL
jgi:uncharacterized membrane protein YhhN